MLPRKPLYQVIHLMLPIQTNSAHLHQQQQQQTPFKLYLLQESNQYLVWKSRKVQDIKNTPPLKILKKEDRLDMKSPAQEALSTNSVFQI